MCCTSFLASSFLSAWKREQKISSSHGRSHIGGKYSLICRVIWILVSDVPWEDDIFCLLCLMLRQFSNTFMILFIYQINYSLSTICEAYFDLSSYLNFGFPPSMRGWNLCCACFLSSKENASQSFHHKLFNYWPWWWWNFSKVNPERDRKAERSHPLKECGNFFSENSTFSHEKNVKRSHQRGTQIQRTGEFFQF